MTAICLLLLLAPDEESPVEVHGALLSNYAGRTSGDRPPAADSDFVLAEERLRADVSAVLEDVEASFRARVEGVYDAIDGEASLDLREVYMDHRTGPLDLRLGRQVITWGVGDVLYVNDVFPKDWVSFFTGRPMEYFKVPVDALRGGLTWDVINFDLVIAPFFQPDILPEPDRFCVFDPFPGMARVTDEPESTFSNIQWALRAYRRIADTDVALYATRGFWTMPSMEPSGSEVEVFYPGLDTFGASAQRGLLGGVAGLEVGYYDSREDREGTDPAIPNSEFLLLAVYQKELATDLIVELQYRLEWMEDHRGYEETLPAGYPEQDQFRSTVTLRVTRFLEHQAWRLSLFVIYGAGEGDFLLVPEVAYRISDSLSLTISARVFGGDPGDTQFGSLDCNDNVSVSLRFDF